MTEESTLLHKICNG